MTRQQMIWTIALALLITLGASAPSTATPQVEEQKTVQIDLMRSPPGVWSVREGGFLGILMIDLTPELRVHFGVSEDVGVMISSVSEDSPASEAGIRVGDIITSIDGESMGGSGEVVHSIGSRQGGEPVTLELYRDGSYLTIEATLGERERTQFWLNTLGHTGGHLRIQGEDGASVFVLPGGPDTGELHLKGEAVDEVMGNLHQRLASPEFRGRMMEFRSNTEQLEERIKELEQKLQELARQLEALEN